MDNKHQAHQVANLHVDKGLQNSAEPIQAQAVQEVLARFDLLLQSSAESITAMVGKCSELTKPQRHGKAEALPVLSGSGFNERSTVKKFQ